MKRKDIIKDFNKKLYRLTTKEKEAGDFQWYKDKADYYEKLHNTNFSTPFDFKEVSVFQNNKVNYDLFNGKVNMKELSHVLSPYGKTLKNVPVKIRSRDIISSKIKVILGLEMKRPFHFSVVATNPEAIARKEKEEFDQLKNYVSQQIMNPIKEAIQKENLPKEEDGSSEDKAEIQNKINNEIKARTPEEVKHYMLREHKDAVEIMSNQLLKYQIKELDLKNKFNIAYKHMNLSAKEIMYVGVLNKKVQAWNVNSLYFSHDSRRDLINIEDGEWAVADYHMSISEITNYFNLEDDEIDELYANWKNHQNIMNEDSLFTFENEDERLSNNSHITVRHIVWKDLKPLKILTYLDEENIEQTMFVSETYSLNKENGDISLQTIWEEETYECWKINELYKNMNPVINQYRGIDDSNRAKLPYIGVVIDNMNSKEVSLMSRGRHLQYEYDLVSYRIDTLVATDKGKKVLMNIDAVPDSKGIDLESWQNFFETSPFMWYDKSEEGYSDANTIAKVIDLSLVSDISKYLSFLDHIKLHMGKMMGIPEQMEGEIGPNEAVTNTKQTLIQTSHILEPYFNLHDIFKKNVLQAVLEASKIAYHGENIVKLSYVLDDLSTEILRIDSELLNSSKLSIHVANSTKTEEARSMIKELALTAMQSQTIQISDVLEVLEKESVAEATESLKIAEEKNANMISERARQEQESKEQMQKMLEVEEEKRRNHEKEMIILKEEERRKTEIQKVAMMGMSFNPETDTDNDGVNDFLEVAKYGLDADIKRDKNKLEKDKFEYQKIKDKEDIKLTKEKLKIEKIKASKTNK